MLRGGRHTGPRLVLLHGLGATAEVWTGLGAVLDERWPGPWLAPDLPGHGRSAALPAYTFAALADAVAAACGPLRDAVVVGHSLGGVLALTLAGRQPLRAAVGVGIKVDWTDEELARAAALAARPPSWFGSRADAVARHLRVAGLEGLLDPADPAAAAGVVEVDGRFRLALDGPAFGVGEPGVAELLAAARGPVVLARGEHDPMVSAARLRALDPAAVELPGRGHNVHVEDPAAVWSLVAPFAVP
jgi:pimeloyl-ACP methyl ester carboxylesterase